MLEGYEPDFNSSIDISLQILKKLEAQVVRI